ncbi:hypothetical protein GCM10009848_56250 [Micromonospora lupini]
MELRSGRFLRALASIFFRVRRANFTVVDMAGYSMEWRIAMAKRADASGRKDVIRIGF